MDIDPIMGESTTSAPDTFATPLDQMKEKLANEGEPVAPKSILPPELFNLTKEQIQEFKRVLEITPDQPEIRKNKNIEIKLRQIDGKIVEDLKDGTFSIRVRDANDREVEREHIKIKFFGETEYRAYPYNEFMVSPRIALEVVKIDTQTQDIVVGETMSRVNGRLVEMTRTLVKTRFTVKLPTGELVEIDGKMANA
jgi:hypothetical protein